MSRAPSDSHLTAGGLGSDNAGRKADLTMLYELALGREPESAATVAAMLAFPDDHLPIILFSSQEARDRIEGLRHGQDPWRGSGIPGREIAEWAACRLPLSVAGRDRVRSAGWSWPALFFALASDPLFVTSTGATVLADPEIVAILADRARSRGMIEELSDDIVIGWALPDETGEVAESTPAALEVWLDGIFVGAMLADRFRRDIQDRIGGDGRVGFVFDLAGRLRVGGQALVEVRRVVDGATVGFRRVSLAPAPIDAIASARAEIAQLKNAVERLERSLPSAVVAAGGATLANWNSYVQAWYSGMDAERPEGADWAVILDAVGADPKSVQMSLASAADQMRALERVVLIAAAEQADMAEDLARRTRLLGPCEIVVVPTEAMDPADRLAAALPTTGDMGHTLLLQAGDVLHPAALALMTHRFSDQPVLRALYVDEDCLDVSLRPARRVDPVLKPGPDPDLLLQTPYVGRTLAFRTTALARGPFTSGLDGWHGPALVQRWIDVPGAVDHLALALVTRTAPPENAHRTQSAWLRL
jgi:O-antigen biosynthesis protein